MDVMLQAHRAKQICDIPDGLRELCSDISREVMRSQPDDICCFIAEYLDSLVITRENAKVAMKLVQHVVLRSEHIMDILGGTSLKLEEIAAAAPRLQKAFRAYLEAVDAQKEECGCDGEEIYDIEDECESTIGKILKETGATREEANAAATKIQALFRGHFDRLWLAQQRGEVRWQRAVVTTMEILRKLGITQNEATHAAIIIQSAYRGYYTRKLLRSSRKVSEYEVNFTAWLEMMFEVTGLTLERANQAATIIQKTYREHLRRKRPAGDLTSSTNVSQAVNLDKAASSVVLSRSDAKSDETVGSIDSDESGDLGVQPTQALKPTESSAATLSVASSAEEEKQQPETTKENEDARTEKSETPSEAAAEPERVNEPNDEEKKSVASKGDVGKSEDVKQEDEKGEDAKPEEGKSEVASPEEGKSEAAKQDDANEIENVDDGKSEVDKPDDEKSAA